MNLYDFIESHKNWEQILTGPPYNININHDDGYVILSYNHYSSDMSEQMVQEARGIIFTEDGIPVCVPMYKFFNQIEPLAAPIDWSTAKVMQKVDGSLIKIWYHNNRWRVSTNNTIDARKAIIGENNLSFYDLVNGVIPIEKITENLDKNFTYMFELTCPENEVIVKYNEPSLWYICRRNNISFQEDFEHPEIDGIKFPEFYHYHNLEECNKIAEMMTENEEGFVVVDDNFNRVKIKSHGWLNAFRIGNLTHKKVINLWREGSADDFRGVPMIEEFFTKFNNAAQCLEEIYEERKNLSRSEIAKFKDTGSSYTFSRLNSHTNNAKEYLSSIFNKTLRTIINY